MFCFLQVCHFRPYDIQNRYLIWEYLQSMMTSSYGNTFRVNGPFRRGIHRLRLPHKGQWRGALMFSLICAPRTNGWANNREAGDLRRHRAHYDVTVMSDAGPVYTRDSDSAITLPADGLPPKLRCSTTPTCECLLFFMRQWITVFLFHLKINPCGSTINTCTCMCLE